MKMMKWNGMRGLEWKWIRMRLIEVAEKKREMGMNAYRTWMIIGMKIRDEW